MNSIRLTLVVMLMAAFTLVSFLAALNGYLSSMDEAEKLLDKQLLYASNILAVGGESAGQSQALENSSGFAFQVWRDGQLLRGSAGMPTTRDGEFAEGYHYENFSGYRWRTFMRQSGSGDWLVVAERADLRHILAEKVVLESVLPLMLWLPVSGVLVWVLVGWGLRPLRDLSRQINVRRSDDLQAVDYPDPPQELRPLLESTNALLARLSAAFEREKHFASHAAHELRTPLSVLKVHLHNLASELPPGHGGLAHADAGLARMHHLVEQILDFNRTNPEIIKANFSRLDLHQLAQRITADMWPSFEQRHQVLSMTGDIAHMYGDEVMLETLLRNLLDNAGKYTPAGGEVQVFVGSEEGIIRLQVEDSGPGVPTADRERVFERFYRVRDGASAVVGSGLGLAIVQHIVQLHNARIVLADSQFDSGLSVTVEFPQEEHP
ncbi:MAG: ATP-binding protein [Halioglobus sp.]